MPEAPPRTLVLLRHGRTAWNHMGRVQGQLDVDLDDVGREQAATAARVLAKLGPTLLWSSDLLRARATAAAVAEATGLAPTYDARLREFHLGERQGLTHDEFAAVDPAGFAEFRTGRYDAAPGAEPVADVGRRMSEALHDLLSSLAPGETGVAVSHGAAVRVATGVMLGWPDEQFHTLRGLDNCGWVVLEQHADATGLRLRAYNRTG